MAFWRGCARAKKGKIISMSEIGRYYRVFGSNDAQPPPEELLMALAEAKFRVEAEYLGDDQGWYGVRLRLPGRAEPVDVQRFVTAVDDIRGDLSTWAAWVESQFGCDRAWLLQQLISTTQLFAWQVQPEDAEAVALSAVLCDYLGRATAGLYQVDGLGLFDLAGTLLVPEIP
jgi:hypothetical protein